MLSSSFDITFNASAIVMASAVPICRFSLSQIPDFPSRLKLATEDMQIVVDAAKSLMMP